MGAQGPVRRASLLRVLALAGDKSMLAPRTVLVVEGEPMISMNMENVMIAVGFRPVMVRTLEAARGLVEARPFAFAFLDHGPDRSLLMELSRVLSERAVPFSICSAYSAAADTARALGVPFVSKPFMDDDLAAIIRAALLPRRVTEVSTVTLSYGS